MNIALVSFSVVTRGGTQRQFLSLAHALRRKSHEVTVYTLDKGTEYGYPDLVQGVTLKTLKGENGEPKPSSLPGIFGGLSRKIRRKKLLLRLTRIIAEMMDKDTEVINAHDDESYKVAHFFKKHNPSVTAIWTMNDPPVSYLSKGSVFVDALVKFFNFFELMYERKFLRATDAIAVLDERNSKMAEKYYRRPTCVVRSGLDFEKFYQPIEARDPKAVMRIFSFGIVAPHRRFEDVVTAAALLKKGEVSMMATIMGHSSGEEGKAIELLARNKGVESVVELRFSKKGVSDEMVKEAYHRHDIFLFPNDPQTWGLTVFEAMAAGLVAIVSKTAGASEVLTDREDALLIRPREPREIAAKIRWLIAHPEEYERLRKNGQEFVKNKISWDVYATSMIRLFSR